MAKYVRKAETVEALMWNKVGDVAGLDALDTTAKGKEVCNACGLPWSVHAQREVNVDMFDTICPGRWIVTHEDGRVEYLKDETFQARYTEVK